MSTDYSDSASNSECLCVIESCDKPREGRGLCAMHYARWRRHGDPTVCLHDHGRALMWLRAQLVEGDRGSGCWEWPFSRKPAGYGQVLFRGKTTPAQAVALILDGSNSPEGERLCACHSCDNPPCVNPSHLWWGTYLDNRRDAVKKGRARGAPQRLTAEQVRAIRLDSRSSYIVGPEFGVDPRTIREIRARTSRANVPD